MILFDENICFDYEKLAPSLRLSYSQKILTIAYLFFISSLLTAFVVTMYVFNYIDKKDRDFFLMVYASGILFQIVTSCLLLRLARKIRLYNDINVKDNENVKDLA